MLNRITKGKRRTIYYGISEAVNGRLKDWKEVVAKIPDNRILAESDLSDPDKLGIALERVYEMISEAKGWQQEETRSIIRENLITFLA